jgi:hypothetical protein
LRGRCEMESGTGLAADRLLQGPEQTIHRSALAAIGRRQHLPDRLDRLQPFGQVVQPLIARGYSAYIPSGGEYLAGKP